MLRRAPIVTSPGQPLTDRFDRRGRDLWMGRFKICRLEIRQRTLQQPNIKAHCGQQLKTIVGADFGNDILEKFGFHKWKAGVDELRPTMRHVRSRASIAGNIGSHSSPARFKMLERRSSYSLMAFRLIFVADDALDKVDECSRAQGALFKHQKKTLKMRSPLAVFRKRDDVGFASCGSSE